jgi:hypothetical protein
MKHHVNPDPQRGPLLQLAMQVIKEDPETKFAIDDAGRKALKKEVIAAIPSPKLLEMMAELLAFAGWLRMEHDAVAACDAIVEASRPAFPAIRERGLEGKTDAVDERALAAAARFLGNASPIPLAPEIPQPPARAGQVRHAGRDAGQ